MHISSRIPRPSVRAVAIAVGLGLCLSAIGHQGRRRNGPRPPVAVPIPFPFISKRAGFDVKRPTAESFNEMQALLVDLTPAHYPALKAKQSFVQMEYGYRKGGIVTVYETKKIPGGNAQKAFQASLDCGAFRDRPNLPGWSIQVIPDGKLFIGIGATSPAVRAAFMASFR